MTSITREIDQYSMNIKSFDLKDLFFQLLDELDLTVFETKKDNSFNYCIATRQNVERGLKLKEEKLK